MYTRTPPVLQPLPWEPARYIDPTERQRIERVAVGRICGCGDCYCCTEYRADVAARRARYDHP